MDGKCHCLCGETVTWWSVWEGWGTELRLGTGCTKILMKKNIFICVLASFLGQFSFLMVSVTATQKALNAGRWENKWTVSMNGSADTKNCSHRLPGSTLVFYRNCVWWPVCWCLLSWSISKISERTEKINKHIKQWILDLETESDQTVSPPVQSSTCSAGFLHTRDPVLSCPDPNYDKPSLNLTEFWMWSR